jgi:hypothetical protein
MSVFYCRECGAKNGLLNTATGFNPTGSPYQRVRFIKHTTPTGIYPINSVFDDPSFTGYSGYLASAITLGCLEVDNWGRSNRVWDAGKRVGQTLDPNAAPRPDSAVKAVLPYSPTAVHAFSTASDLISSGRCASCGGPLANS